MKKQLEIKYIAPYLPYGVKINVYCPIGNLLFKWMELSNYQLDRISQIKPILRPLSDLTKEIEHNGKKFVPIDVLGLFNCKVSKCNNIENHNGYIFPVTNLDYNKVNKLFEWHFDVFGLIEDGLAVDVNIL